MSTQQLITKINKSAEVLFNTSSSIAVGKQIAELLGIKNNHFLAPINKLVSKTENDENKDGDRKLLPE